MLEENSKLPELAWLPLVSSLMPTPEKDNFKAVYSESSIWHAQHRR